MYTINIDNNAIDLATAWDSYGKILPYRIETKWYSDNLNFHSFGDPNYWFLTTVRFNITKSGVFNIGDMITHWSRVSGYETSLYVNFIMYVVDCWVDSSNSNYYYLRLLCWGNYYSDDDYASAVLKNGETIYVTHYNYPYTQGATYPDNKSLQLKIDNDERSLLNYNALNNRLRWIRNDDYYCYFITSFNITGGQMTRLQLRKNKYNFHVGDLYLFRNSDKTSYAIYCCSKLYEEGGYLYGDLNSVAGNYGQSFSFVASDVYRLSAQDFVDNTINT